MGQHSLAKVEAKEVQAPLASRVPHSSLDSCRNRGHRNFLDKVGKTPIWVVEAVVQILD